MLFIHLSSSSISISITEGVSSSKIGLKENKKFIGRGKKKCDVLNFILGEPRMLAVHRKMNSIHCLTLQVDGACTLFKCTKL